MVAARLVNLGLTILTPAQTTLAIGIRRAQSAERCFGLRNACAHVVADFARIAAAELQPDGLACACARDGAVTGATGALAIFIAAFRLRTKAALAIGSRRAIKAIAAIGTSRVRAIQAINASSLVVANAGWAGRTNGFRCVAGRGIAIGARAHGIVCAGIAIVRTCASARTRAIAAALATAASAGAAGCRFNGIGRKKRINFASVEHHAEAQDRQGGKKNRIMFHDFPLLTLRSARERRIHPGSG